VREIAPGIWHWTGRHPRTGVPGSSYFLSDARALVDPLAPPDLDRLEEPRLMVLTCRHHLRDAVSLHERLGCPVLAPRPGMHEFSDDDPVEPYGDGDELAGDALVAHEVDAISPDEYALHAPTARALAVADGVTHYSDSLEFVPDRLMDDPERTKQGLREAFARLCDELEFDHLLCAHGEPVVGDGRERLRRFAEGG
jgi:glyoxylase-like metal-dependent hydrolase (beta-lactamase superfamily II)